MIEISKNRKRNMRMRHAGFTMIELVFVIVVIGILAAIAIPRFAATRQDAVMVKIKSQVAEIRNAIAVFRAKTLSTGVLAYPTTLDQGVGINTGGVKLFDDNDNNKANGYLLDYGIMSEVNKEGGWVKKSNPAGGVTQYQVQVGGVAIEFDYNASTGLFDCNGIAANNSQAAKDYCTQLTK